MKVADKNIIVFIIIASSIFLLPSIITDVLYRDDAYRLSINGGYWWWLGRPLADAIIYITSMSENKIINSHPFGLILSLVIFITLVRCIINNRMVMPFNYAKAPIVFILVSPFFIQNISYQYDAPGMILSLSMAMMSFYVISINTKFSVFISVLLLFLSLCFYQPCANIFLGLSAINIITKIRNGDKNKLFYLCVDMVIFVSSYLLYFFVIVKILGFADKSRANIINIYDVLSSIHHVTRDLYSIYILPFFSSGVVIIYSLLLITSILLISKRIKLRKVSAYNIVCSVLSFFVAMILFLFSIIGISFLIPEGISGARVLVGFATVTMLIATISIKALNDRYPLYISSILLIPTLVLTYQSFKYGSEQRRYEYFIMNEIGYDLANNNASKAYLVGQFKLSPPVKSAIDHNRAIGLFVSGSQPWVSKRLMYSLGVVNIEQGWNSSPKEAFDIINTGDEIIKNKNYSIYKKDNNVTIAIN